MRGKNSIKNMIASLFSNATTIIVGFIAQTIFIKILGTEYLGLEGKNLRCNHVDFLLYKINNNPANIEIEVHTLAGVEDKIEKQTIIVNNKDWKGTGMRLRITPRVNIGNAFRAQIKSKDHIAVSALSFDIDDLNKNTSASRSAKRL